MTSPNQPKDEPPPDSNRGLDVWERLCPDELPKEPTDNSDLMLERLKIEINEHYASICSIHQSAMDHALCAGELLEKVKLKVGYGKFIPWVVKNCKCKLSTAQLYMRLDRRLRELPHMREKVMVMTLNDADEELRKEREKERKRETITRESIVSRMNNFIQAAEELVDLMRKHVKPEDWENWQGPDADFIKGLGKPPYPIRFPPIGEVLDREDDQADMPPPPNTDEDEYFDLDGEVETPKKSKFNYDAKRREAYVRERFRMIAER